MTKLNSVLKKNSQLKMALCALIITDDSEILKNENVQLSSKEKSQFCDRIIGTAKLIKGAKRDVPNIIMRHLKAERTAAEKITHDIMNAYDLEDMSADEVLEMSIKLIIKSLLLEADVTRYYIQKAFPEKVTGEVVVEERNSSSFKNKEDVKSETTALCVIEDNVEQSLESTTLSVVLDDESTIRSYMNKFIGTRAGNKDDTSLIGMVKNITVLMTNEFKDKLMCEIRDNALESRLFKELLEDFRRFAVSKYLIWRTDDDIVNAVCSGIIFRSILESPQEQMTYQYQYSVAD